MKRFANEQEPVLRIPPVVKPVVVEDAPVGIAVEHCDVPVAVMECEGAAFVHVGSHPDHHPSNALGIEFYTGL